MCTVTVLPESVLSPVRAGTEGLRLRVACNRDELTTRPPADPPSILRIGPRWAIMPIDPESGGTWIGANDAGLVCALLNVYDGSHRGAASLSRGTIIPLLLGFGDIDSALARACALPMARFRPFQLLLIDAREMVECRLRGRSLEHRREHLREAAIRTSSGLGDRLVTGPRTRLFRTFVGQASDPVAAEDLFHLHQWRGHEAISVRMRRAEARTVSHTVVEVRDDTVRLVYRPADAPDAVSVTVAA
jgi:hypothetical protein